MRNLRYDEHHHLWRVRRQVRGKEHSATFTTKPDAIEWLRNMERRAHDLEPLPAIVNLRQGWKLYQEGLRTRGSPETTFRYYSVKYARLAEFFTPPAVLNRLDRSDIEGYVLSRRRGPRPAGNRTIRAELALLHRMTRRAEVVPQWTMPVLRVQRRPRRAPTPEEVARLWVALDSPGARRDSGARAAKVALALTVLTGMRASEVFRVGAKDVRGDATLHLTNRKTSNEHVVPIVPTLAALLPAAGPLVQASEAAVHSALVRASKRAGIPTWSGPGLGRHCHATWAVAHGGFTQEQVADALGHLLPGAATPAYIHLFAVEPVRRPMAQLVERILLTAIDGVVTGGQVLGFTRGGRKDAVAKSEMP